jgi:hypothetical protein
VVKPRVNLELHKKVQIPSNGFRKDVPPPKHVSSYPHFKHEITISHEPPPPLPPLTHPIEGGNHNAMEYFSWPNHYPDTFSRNKDDNNPPSVGTIGEEIHGQQQILSKRILENCSDEEGKNCESSEFVTKRSANKPSRYPSRKAEDYESSRFRLPYPIYMESMYDDENDPFQHLPPMQPSQFMKTENWVKTWDKQQTGLPPIVGAEEASMESRRNSFDKKKSSRTKKQNKSKNNNSKKTKRKKQNNRKRIS